MANLQIPNNDSFIVGRYSGDLGFGNIELRDIFPGYDCSHNLSPNSEYKDHIGISISEFRIGNDHKWNRSQGIPSELVNKCMWDLYVRFGQKYLREKFNDQDEKDLFGYYVCILLFDKYENFTIGYKKIWIEKIHNDFERFFL